MMAAKIPTEVPWGVCCSTAVRPQAPAFIPTAQDVTTPPLLHTLLQRLCDLPSVMPPTPTHEPLIVMASINQVLATCLVPH